VRQVYSRFDATVAASPSVARELRSLGLENVHTVPLGVDLETFHPRHRTPELRRSLGTPPEVPLALFAGRLCPEKDLDTVVEAHRRMPPGSRPHLLLVGEGPSASRLSEIAGGRSDLTVLPFVSEKDELARIYASADFYLAAGPGETFGLAVAEAMASGLPVVGVDSGAVPDRLEGSEAGELFERGNAESAAEALRRMAARLGSEIRTKARRHAVRAFGWDRTFETLLALYTDLCRDRSRP
jgi:alpha-1,6-mannosyltransferase